MKLKPREKSQLLRGEFPELVRPDQSIVIGEEIVLKTTKTEAGTIPEVAIRITGRHKTKNGSWQADYVVKDDRGLYVSQGLGYTRSPARALDREAPVLDPAVIEAYAVEAQQANALLQGEAARRQKATSLGDELKVAQERGRVGRARVLEAKMAQEIKRAAFPSHAAA